MEYDSIKGRHNRMKRLKSFETQKEGELRGFPISWMKIIDVFLMEGKGKGQERLKI